MIATVAWLAYADLSTVLRSIGYACEESEAGRIYRNPLDPDAILLFTRMLFGEHVLAYHRVAARQIANSFGIVDGEMFDWLLFRTANERGEPVIDIQEQS